ncbi:WXG100 family type VII secretion target [Streptosporangium subroseum]|uniref:WXG100 family type VII secretion target n=1 Tax=Streptosporangium subroseum TaxID=106412 RepID=UPI00341B5B17
MSLFGASPTQLTNVRNYVADTGQYVAGLRSSVEQTAVELNASWHGPAARKFASVMVGWNDEMKIIEDSLTTIAEKMQMNAQRYAAVDADAEAGVGSIQSLINR